jgi:hypothetical protein
MPLPNQQLQESDLRETRVTDVGVQELRQAVPLACAIEH